MYPLQKYNVLFRSFADPTETSVNREKTLVFELQTPHPDPRPAPVLPPSQPLSEIPGSAPHHTIVDLKYDLIGKPELASSNTP